MTKTQQLHAEAGTLYNKLCWLRAAQPYDKRLMQLCSRAYVRWERRRLLKRDAS